MNRALREASDSRPEHGQAELARLRPVANRCTAGTCPTVYASEAGAVVVQGYVVSAAEAGIDVPDGEMLVKIPFDLLAEAVRNLS